MEGGGPERPAIQITEQYCGGAPRKKENENMNIIKEVNGSEVILKIEGRLDTTTAPALEAEIQNCEAGMQKMTMDCSGLEYISSAGLRIILKAQKLMGAREGMRLLHVNDTIMEIFDITGFTDILTIE